MSRKEFYSRDQGARLMPFSWFKALKRADGTGFLDDGLSRYGYLPNPDSPIPGLPVGFLAALDNEGGATLSITCAACHTRQIEIDGAPLRVDGGPGIVDLGSLFNDLDGAYDALLKDDAAFKPFAVSVLGGSPSEEAVKKLKGEVQAWYFPFHKIMFAGVPKPPATIWGPARLDAVGMIFNRVAGLDIGPAPNRVIEGNLAAADAPVRYPFLWNAAIQDMTQWPGFAQNGDDITGLGRNVGEVYGVFGIFHPTPTGDPLVPLDYLKDSSLNFPGLLRLETLIKQMEAPKFPGPIDRKLADKGKEIFDRPAKEGGCGPGCHQEIKGEPRLCNQNTWKTPVQNVETDARENLRLGRSGDTGVLKGQIVPQPPFNELQATDSMANILSVAVVGSIAQGPLHFGPMQFLPLVEECLRNEPISPPEKLEFFKQFLGSQLKGALNAIFRFEEVARPAYEARVMRGIWATAPYLHNGSVPSLAELLKPPAQRVASFKIGPAYDLANVGLAREQTKFDSYVYETTADCGGEKPDASGNSRCGHNFGTALPDEEKKALLEYLKSL
ncbi:hypothetical protein H2LOC_009715 [Methylocystis heyeri]|uniref:Cytochrome c domain-containing protein n=1 Tax=Methylocystis heyeri TaxID=391905 RepID=A0A6B8KKB4_9HYPH|nr:hypothetical protein H2LOC_009715 [Methylocystis heyeri]